MAASLQFETTLEHDGDGLVRYTVSAANEEFSATVGTWTQANSHVALASALTGFTVSSGDRVTCKFGSTGTCELEVFCLDSLGHLGIWLLLTRTGPSATRMIVTSRLHSSCNPIQHQLIPSSLNCSPLLLAPSIEPVFKGRALTIRSSRRHFVARLNSSVRRLKRSIACRALAI